MTTIQPGTEERRQQAVERLRKRSEFWMHLAAYVVVNAVIVLVWYLTTPDVFFWPVIPLAGWGIGLFFHGVETFQRPLSEDRIRREMDRLA